MGGTFKSAAHLKGEETSDPVQSVIRDQHGAKCGAQVSREDHGAVTKLSNVTSSPFQRNTPLNGSALRM